MWKKSVNLLLLGIIYITCVNGLKVPTHTSHYKNALHHNHILRSSTLLQSTLNTIPGVGDDGCKLPSPSGINTLSTPLQFATFAGIWATLLALTVGEVNLTHALQTSFPNAINSWIGTWPILGFIYVAAGIAHFVICDEFSNMMPAPGTWGIWYLPGSKKFHVEWTGVAEVIGGLWLILGYLQQSFGLNLPSELGPNVLADGALWCLLLTILVTPANIYMYTHGAKLPMNGPEIPVWGHYVRLFLQSVLFTQFYILAEPSIKMFL